jgi:hypothetical protein
MFHKEKTARLLILHISFEKISRIRSRTYLVGYEIKEHALIKLHFYLFLIITENLEYDRKTIQFH